MAILTRHRRTPVDENELRLAAEAVEDPEIHRPLGDLGMIRHATAGRNGVAHVEVALTTIACPLRERMRADIAAAVGAVDGVTGVEVTFTTLSERERLALAGRLRGGDRPQLDGATQVYAVASGKGGVGKSTVAANLAVALARTGKRVGLLDADVWGYSVPQLFGIRRNPVALSGLMLPIEAHGVRLMSVGFFVDDGEPVVWRGPMLHKALEQFLADVYWGEPDFLLVDMPPGTGDVAISMANYLPRAETYVVTTPQPAAQRVAQRTALMAKKLNLPLFGVIENMSWFTGDDGTRYELFGAGGGQLLATELDVPLVGQIPLVPALREGGDIGTPVTISDPDGEASQAFDAIARHIVANGPKRIYRSELTVH
jgi:ATP-binding protein involved in chromosome partitioning